MRKGSKRWTSVPIIKTMGTRCPPPLKKERIAHVFLEKFNRELFPKKYKLATNTRN